MAEKQLAYRYEEITSVSNILPRKAMLARYMLWLCVRKVDFFHTSHGVHIGQQAESVGRVLQTKRPKTKKQCRSLLDMVNFYRRYIPNCAKIIAQYLILI